MRKHITILMMLLLGATGITHAQCLSYSLGYAVYATESVGTNNGAGGPVPGTGTVTIGGSEQSGQICTQHLVGGDCERYRTEHDSGTVLIIVNGFSESTSYGQASTASAIASTLATAFNADGSSPVTASVNGSIISLISKTTGAGSNYTLSATSSTDDLSTFGWPSFSPTPSGETLTGGADTSTGGNMLSSVLVDGSASMNLDQTAPGCDPATYGNLVAELPYATHTPVVQNVVNGVGGWTTGTSACVTCYLSQQSNEDSGLVTAGVDYGFTYGGEVNCSVGGLIFIFSGFFNWEVAFTRFVTGGYVISEIGPDVVRAYFIGPYCSRPTTPPDWTGAGLHWITPDPPPYPTDVVDGKTICLRVGNSGPWTCAPYGVFTGGSYNLPWPLGNCTHNP